MVESAAVMHPILFSLGPFALHSYGLCMALGILCAYAVLVRLAQRRGIASESLSDLVVALVLAGLAGARSFYVAEHWTAQYAADPLAAVRIWEGGLMFYGSIVFGAAGLVVWCRWRHRSVREWLDLFAVVVPLGQAFGRIGCFLTGCCHGRAADTVLSVRYPAHSMPWLEQVRSGALAPLSDGSLPPRSLPVLPTQLFEAAGCLALFALLWRLFRRLHPVSEAGKPSRFPGAVAAGYFLGYGAIRFVDEIFRADERLHFGWFSISQSISVALWALGLFLLAALALRRRRAA